MSKRVNYQKLALNSSPYLYLFFTSKFNFHSNFYFGNVLVKTLNTDALRSLACIKMKMNAYIALGNEKSL